MYSLDDLSVSEVENLIDEWIFNERNRRILKRRLIDGVTYERIAEEFDLSVRQVKNIIYKSEIRVFAHVSK